MKTNALNLPSIIVYNVVTHLIHPPILYFKLSHNENILWIVLGFSNMSQFMISENKVSFAYEKNMNKGFISISCWHKVFYYDW